MFTGNLDGLLIKSFIAVSTFQEFVMLGQMLSLFRFFLFLVIMIRNYRIYGLDMLKLNIVSYIAHSIVFYDRFFIFLSPI